MKTGITPAMAAHLLGTVTTLCRVCRIIREDEVAVYLTEHDRDLPYEGNAYLSSPGFSSGAIGNAASLAPDAFDLQTVLSDGHISRADVRAGRYDYAQIEVAMVNWADTTMGEIPLRGGRLGEVRLSPSGMVTAELPGLAFRLGQNLLSTYQPQCRWDLGQTPGCGVSIYPAVLGREMAVQAGQFYRVPTKSPSGLTWPNLLQNHSFELDGKLTATNEITGWSVDTNNVDVDDEQEELIADDGTYFLGGSLYTTQVSQTVDLVAAGVSGAHVDAGNVTTDLSVKRANSDVDDTGRVRLQVLDADQAVLATLYDSGEEAVSPLDTWIDRGDTGMVLPSGTRYLKVLLGLSVVSSPCSAAFDNAVLSVSDSAGTNTYHELYENRVYEVTTGGTTAVAQPAYDTTPGNTTTDGTAVLTCRDAFMRHAWVGTLITRKRLTIVVDEPRAIDDWFRGGALVFETGDNVGRAHEIRTWDGDLALLVAYLDLPFLPNPGDRIRLYAGCNKRLGDEDAPGDCNEKFNNVINFGGDPFVPGEDIPKSSSGGPVSSWRKKNPRGR